MSFESSHTSRGLQSLPKPLQVHLRTTTNPTPSLRCNAEPDPLLAGADHRVLPGLHPASAPRSAAPWVFKYIQTSCLPGSSLPQTIVFYLGFTSSIGAALGCTVAGFVVPPDVPTFLALFGTGAGPDASIVSGKTWSQKQKRPAVHCHRAFPLVWRSAQVRAAGPAMQAESTFKV